MTDQAKTNSTVDPQLNPPGRGLFATLKEVIEIFIDNNCLQGGAALAYYSIFSLGPILIIVMTITGYFLGSQIAQEHVLQEVTNVVGSQSAEMLQEMISSTKLRGQSVLFTLVTIAGLLFAATGVFGTLEFTLNQIWNTPVPEGNVLKHFFLTRIRSFGLLVMLGFLLLATQLFSSVINLALLYFDTWLATGTELLVAWINYAVSMVVSTLLFMVIFKTFSYSRTRWIDLFAGATFTAALFVFGRYLITFYIEHSTAVSSYGVASSVIVIMLWAYYSALILLLGACFTSVISRRNNLKLEQYDR